MVKYRVRVAAPSDIASWLLVAREVEYLFGPMADMPEFKNALMNAIQSNLALCATSVVSTQCNDIVGGIVFSHNENSIDWLAVTRRARGLGLGRKLLSAALDRLDVQKPIHVQTFSQKSPEGKAARKLYLAFGFEDKEPREPTPAGIPTVIMEKPPIIL